MPNDTKADVPEIVRAEHDDTSGNKKINLYFWNTQTLAWQKLSGTSSGITIDPTNLDSRYVNVTGDTMTGALQFNAGGLAISDSSGNELIKVSEVASAVNEITISNAATSQSPSITATGGDAAISLTINPKGTGALLLNTLGVQTLFGTTSYQNISGSNSSSVQIATNNANNRWLPFVYYQADANGAQMALCKSSSSTLNTLSYPNLNDELGRYVYAGADVNLARFVPAVQMTALAAETWSATARGSSYYIATTPIGTTAAGVVFRLTSEGLCLVGGSNAAAAKLHVVGNVSSSAWTSSGIGLRFDAATYTDTTSSGTVALGTQHTLSAPTIAATNATTYTEFAILYISGNPTAGTNVTISNPEGIYNAGRTRLNSVVSIGPQVSVPQSRLRIGGALSNSAAIGVTGAAIRVDAFTFTDTASSGTVATWVTNGFAQTTLATSNVTTFTDVASVYIAGGVIAGANVTLTNVWGLWNVAKTRLDQELFIGGTTATNVEGQTTAFLQISTNSTARRFNSLAMYQAGANSQELAFCKSRSGTIGTLTYPTLNDPLGIIKFCGADENTVQFEATAQVQVTADETWISTSHATRMSFATTEANAVSASNRLIIGSTGDICIGSTATPTARLLVTTGTTQAAWGVNGVGIRWAAATYTDNTTAQSTTVATGVAHGFATPTFAASNTGVTITDGATWYIANAPANGTNVTITNSWSLWVDAGDVRLDGNLDFFTSGNGINDANKNELIKFTTTASAVNEFTIANGATGNAPTLSVTGGDTNIDIKLSAKGTGVLDVTSVGKHEKQYYAVQYTTTTALDWNNGNVQYIQLASGAQTFTFSNPLGGGRYVLILKQPGSGAAGTVTWPTISWAGGTTPTLTTTNNKVDIITLIYDGTNTVYYGNSSLNY